MSLLSSSYPGRMFSPLDFPELLSCAFPETVAYGKNIYHCDLGRENMEAANRFVSMLLVTTTLAAAFFNTLLALFSASLAACAYLSACTLKQDRLEIEAFARIQLRSEGETLRTRCAELEVKIKETEEALEEALINLLAAENRDQERNSEYTALRLQLHEAVQARREVEAALADFQEKLKSGITALEAQAAST